MCLDAISPTFVEHAKRKKLTFSSLMRVKHVIFLKSFIKLHFYNYDISIPV